MHLCKNVKVDQILGYFAAGTSVETSDIIDMAGYDGVLFIAELGTIIAGGTIAVDVYGNTVNSTSGMTILAGTSAYTVTAGGAALTQSCILVDCYRPLYEFLEVKVTPASQNAVILGVTAIRYSGKYKPEANTTPKPLKATTLVGATV